jgi:NAD(P)-dependent dehydrogenase (short-subunit alcohol dehydrogenase family)
MRIQDSVFIVTGGASGLGEATVRRLHRGGAKLIIADVAGQAGASLAEALGEGALFRATDVTDESAALQAVQLARERYGALHGLINCAGIAPGEKVAGRQGPHRLDTFTRCIHINLIGTFNMIRLAAAAMRDGPPNAAGERGVIVNTASIAAYEGQVGQAAYAASKAGIIGMTLPIARELAGAGIRVVSIAPGLFHTPLMDALPSEVRDSLGKTTPFPPRLGRPDEFAALVQHVIENEMLNGSCIRLDGAVRLAAR